MKTLFITAGIVPARGVSNSYQESLMEGIAARGHQVACLCLAEVNSRPGMSWTCSQQEPYRRYDIFNAGIYPARYSQGGVGSHRPLRDVHAPSALRRVILEIIDREQPDVISIQSLFGFPFDLIDEIKKAGIPVVFTAHDYFMLCPTAHLFLPEEQPCRLPEDKLVCHQCCAESPSYNAFRLSWQLDRLANNFSSRPLIRQCLWRARNAVKRVDGLMSRPAHPCDYSARRRQAVEILKRIDVLHCISRHQAKVFQEICGALSNIRVLPLMPPTIEKLTSVPRLKDEKKIMSFVALNVNGAYKGVKLLESAFKKLAGTRTDYELHVYGNSVPGPEIPSVFYHGRYKGSELDPIAARADFCIIPSVWDETLGFVGLEMLARGVPLIVSARAGVSDFVRDSENGFIFEPESSDRLCAAIEKALAQPVATQSSRTSLGGPALVPFRDHVSEMEALLQGAAQGRKQPSEVLCP